MPALLPLDWDDQLAAIGERMSFAQIKRRLDALHKNKPEAA